MTYLNSFDISWGILNNDIFLFLSYTEVSLTLMVIYNFKF